MSDHDFLPPTRERLKRGELIPVEVKMFDGLHKAVLDLRATLLDRYWRDQLLLGDTADLEAAAARHEAGQRLQALYEETGLRRRLMAFYGTRTQAHGEMTEDQERAYVAYQGVMRKLSGTGADVLAAVLNLCIHETEPVDHRKLRAGLDVLVRHWGL